MSPQKITRTHILLCSFNGKKYIKDQICSIINQSVPINFIHIYDFGSTDGTITEIKALESLKNVILNLKILPSTYSASKSFITALIDLRPLLKPNDIVYVCDQDDIWDFYKNESVMEAEMQFENKPFLIHHDVEIVDENLNPLNKSFYSKDELNMLRKEIPHRFILSTVIGHTICMNRHAVDSILSYDTDFTNNLPPHDWLWASIIEYTGKVRFLNKKLSSYRQHNNNLVGANIGQTSLKKKINSSYSNSKFYALQKARLESLLTTHFSIWRLFLFYLKLLNFKMCVFIFSTHLFQKFIKN